MRVPRFVLFIAIRITFIIAIAPSAWAQYIYNRADFPIATGHAMDVAIADFNGDGVLDLAVVMGGLDVSQGKLSILLGKPDGTFGPHTDYPLGVYSSHVVVEDFNGDGKLDVAVLNMNLGDGGPLGPSSVSVLLGNGDGTFQAQIASSFGASVSGTYGMAVGDFNGDDKLDLVGVITGGSIEVIPGIGDGTFGSPIATQVTTNYPYQLLSLVTGDFNNDGKLDVAVPLYPGSVTNPTVAILLGRGDGSLQGPLIYPMKSNQDLVAADVNHDGNIDLIGEGSSTAVLLGKGDGTFLPEVDSSVAIGLVVVADINGDGNPDLVGMGNPSGFARIGVCTFFGNGKGSFQSSGPCTPTPYYAGIASLGDFNGDGVLDLAITGSPSRVSILLGNGNGTWGGTNWVTGSGSQTAAIADFNGDGKLDLALGGSQPAFLSVGLGTGAGAFTSGSSLALPSSSGAFVAVPGDFNGDGKPDLAALLGYPCNCIQIFLGDGAGTFTAGSQLPAIFDDDVLLVGNFHGNGKLDLLVGGISSPARLLQGNGDGTFQPPVGVINWEQGQTGQLITADFNHDGKLDVAATTNNANTLQIFLGMGNGTFQPGLSFPTDFNPEGLATSDFNGDGRLDIAIASGDGVMMFLGNGDGTFQPYTENQQTDFVDWITVGDFNGDGKTDLAVGDRQEGILDLLLGNGDGTFSAPIDFSVGRQLLVLTSGDLNGDETPDIVSSSSNGLGVWISAPLGAIGPRSLNFGGVAVGSSSAAQTLTLWNIGSAPLKVNGVTASADFPLINNCGSSVPVGGQCSISVTFSPAGGGTRDSSLVLTDNATVHELTVPLRGTGTGLSVSLSPSSVTLGAALVGATTNSQSVTLTNSGTAGLSLSGISITGPFAIVTSGTTCQATGIVASTSSCAVAVDFTPTAGGQAIGSLAFSDNGAGSPQRVSLNGTGLGFTLAAASGSTTTATVTPGQTASYKLSFAATPGFNTTVNLTCTGAPSLAMCTVSPAAIPSSGSPPGTITVTVTTTAGSIMLPQHPPAPPDGRNPEYRWTLFGFLLCAALAVSLAAATRRRAPNNGMAAARLSFTISLIAAMVMAMTFVACGGGGGGGGGGTPGTPAGTYTLTLTGTATSGSTTLTQNLTLTLTVN